MPVFLISGCQNEHPHIEMQRCYDSYQSISQSTKNRTLYPKTWDCSVYANGMRIVSEFRRSSVYMVSLKPLIGIDSNITYSLPCIGRYLPTASWVFPWVSLTSTSPVIAFSTKFSGFFVIFTFQLSLLFLTTSMSGTRTASPNKAEVQLLINQHHKDQLNIYRHAQEK